VDTGEAGAAAGSVGCVVRRRRVRPSLVVPQWVEATGVPEGWPGGFEAWWSAVGAWYDAHPEAFGHWIASLSVPIDTRER
jgi:hypothetical protein